MSSRALKEAARSVPILAETEVLVVGGGPAGIAAALGAARTGARTLLMERYGHVGGLCTGGLVIGIPPAHEQESDDPAVLIPLPGLLGVITNEIHDRLAARGATERDTGGRWWSWWYPEETKLLLVDMLEEAGVQCLFHTWAGEAVLSDDECLGRISLKGVVGETKSGPQAVLAQVTIDCTGDADVAARAGVPYWEGDEQRSTLPISQVYVFGGVDADRYHAWLAENPPRGGSTTGPELGFRARMRQFRPGEFRGSHGKVNDVFGADVWDLTKAEIEARRTAVERLEWMRENIPGCEKAYFSYCAPQLGVRDTRRIQGVYVLRGAEMQAGIVLDDHIGFIKEGKSVPYRALVPTGEPGNGRPAVDGLLVAGRPISQDYASVEATRSIPPCFVTGFAAGVAAALSVQSQVAPRELSIMPLQTRLKDHGVIFPPWL